MAAVADQLHLDVVMTAIQQDQQVCCVKPLVLRYSRAQEIEKTAYARGFVAGIEHHKRFDDGSLKLEVSEESGAILAAGHCFQHWCTVENSDAFAYIGCHYVDLVAFITGLEPVAVNVYGIRDQYPNGNVGFLWTDARVIWNNGAALNVQNSLLFRDSAPGANTQGLIMYCKGPDNGALLDHSDQCRGLKYSHTRAAGTSGSNGLRRAGPRLLPISRLRRPRVESRLVTDIVRRVYPHELQACRGGARSIEVTGDAFGTRFSGIMATPANSSYNERLLEPARKSILNGGVQIDVEPASG
jgi:D-galacturonate reductase